MRSSLFTLDWKDLGKGLLMAILTPVIATLVDSLNTGSFQLNLPLIATTALAGGIGYLKMRFLSNDAGEFLTSNKG